MLQNYIKRFLKGVPFFHKKCNQWFIFQEIYSITTAHFKEHCSF